MVRIGTPSAVARPEWYDRNPAPAVAYYVAVNVSPHSVTKRVDYTCPAGKKAMVELLQAEVFRRTTATTAVMAHADFKLTPSGGPMATILTARVVTNDIKDKDSLTMGASFMMFAGDVLEGYTEDTSTGGACDYKLCMKVTQFDA